MGRWEDGVKVVVGGVGGWGGGGGGGGGGLAEGRFRNMLLDSNMHVHV